MKYFLLALFLSLAGASYAQTAMRDLLKTMPAALTPSLSENNRLDMVDFKDAGMAAIVTNAFEGKSELTQLTDNYASLRLSEALHLDMALLTAGGERVLCVVMTWGTDLRESTLSFSPCLVVSNDPDQSNYATCDFEYSVGGKVDNMLYPMDFLTYKNGYHITSLAAGLIMSYHPFDVEEIQNGISSPSIGNGQSSIFNETYDLQGRRVNGQTRGIFIKNGKKFVK